MKVRADRFLIALATVECSSCRASTKVISVVLPPGHETDDSDEIGDEDDVAHTLNAGGWVGSVQSAFLFLVEDVSSKALGRLRNETKHYRRPANADESGTGFRNHCARCGAVFDDQDLVCEPGGAFSPTDELEASQISLIRVDEPIEASVAGYAYEPEFFKALCRA